MICSYNHVRATGNRNQTDDKSKNHTVKRDFCLTVCILFLDGSLCLHVFSLSSLHIQTMINLLLKLRQNPVCSTRHNFIILFKCIWIWQRPFMYRSLDFMDA